MRKFSRMGKIENCINVIKKFSTLDFLVLYPNVLHQDMKMFCGWLASHKNIFCFVLLIVKNFFLMLIYLQQRYWRTGYLNQKSPSVCVYNVVFLFKIAYLGIPIFFFKLGSIYGERKVLKPRVETTRVISF